MNPSLIPIVTGVGGAVLAKLFEKSWNTLEEKIKSHFGKEQIDVRKKAQMNAIQFMNLLNEKIAAIEEKEKYIQSTQSQLEFVMLLNKALFNAAQTDSSERQELLSRLIADKLNTESETVFSLTSKMACDAIANINKKQMRILGLLTTLQYTMPDEFLEEGKYTDDELQDIYQDYLQKKLKHFEELQPNNADYLHLLSVSCITVDNFVIVADLGKRISKGISEGRGVDFIFDVERFRKTEVGSYILKLWDHKGLRTVRLSSIGVLIGYYVFDLMNGEKTDLGDFFDG